METNPTDLEAVYKLQVGSLKAGGSREGAREAGASDRSGSDPGASRRFVFLFAAELRVNERRLFVRLDSR